MAVSQPATFNEEWPDARVFAYLNHLPPEGGDADYWVMYNAFKHMRPMDFERLLTQFTHDGRNIHALGPDGKTIHELIAQYPKQSAPFLAVLEKFNA